MPVRYVGAFACAGIMSACGSSEPATPGTVPGATVPEAVQIVRAVVAPVPERVEAGGLVRAAVTAEIVSRILAPVVAVHVASGDRVAGNAALVTLDARQLGAQTQQAEAAQRAARQVGAVATAQLARAEARLAIAAQTHERMATLRLRNSSTQDELDRARAELDAATADVQAARGAIQQSEAGVDAAAAAHTSATIAESYAVLRAPFAGLVTEVRIDPGSMATPGAPLVVLEDARRYRLEVRLDEARLGLVRVGQTVAVRLGNEVPTATAALAGRVAELSRILDAAHTFTVKVDLPASSSLRSGLFGTATFDGPLRQSLVVPVSSLVERGQLAMVFVVDGGRARLRLVQPGRTTGEQVELLSGVEAGEAIVVRPSAGLADGAAVSATAASSPAAGAPVVTGARRGAIPSQTPVGTPR
jgi:RND family efflux transporter MFP subunit